MSALCVGTPSLRRHSFLLAAPSTFSSPVIIFEDGADSELRDRPSGVRVKALFYPTVEGEEGEQKCWFDGVILEVLMHDGGGGRITCIFLSDDYIDEWDVAPREEFDDLCFPSLSGQGSTLRVSDTRLDELRDIADQSGESDKSDC